MVFTNPVHEVSHEIWDRTTKRRKLDKPGEGDVPALLLVHSCDDSFNDGVRCKQRVEEPEKFLGEWAGSSIVFGLAEHLGLDHSRAHKGCANVRGLVVLVELIPERFVQGYKSGFGGTVVRGKSTCHVSNYGGHGDNVALFCFYYRGQEGTQDVELSDDIHVQGPMRMLGIMRTYVKVRHTGSRPR